MLMLQKYIKVTILEKNVFHFAKSKIIYQIYYYKMNVELVMLMYIFNIITNENMD